MKIYNHSTGMLLRSIRLCFLYGTLALLISGCITVQPFQRPEPMRVPQQFPGQSDSASIGELPWSSFFNDKYLQNLIDTTLRNNYDLRIALRNIDIAKANYFQTRGALLPSVTGVASAGVEKYGRNTLNGKGFRGTVPNTDFFLGLQSSWEIDIWKRLRNQRKAAYLRLLSSEYGVRFVKTSLVAEVARRYYDLLALDQKLAIIRRNIKLQQSAVEIVSIQKEGGRATELAVQQFKAQVLHTQSLEVAFQQQITETENELNLLARRAPRPILRNDSLPDILLTEKLTTGMPSSLLLHRPDIQQAELQLQAGEADVAVARAAFLPALRITPFAGLNPTNPTQLLNPGSIALGLIGGLTAPVINRVHVQSNYQRTKAATQQAFYNYQNVVASAYYEVANQLNAIVNLQKSFNLKTKEATTLQHAVNISKDLYLAGYATYLEVILAQRNVVDVELESVNTRNDLLQAQIKLYRSLGGGWY